MSSDIRACLTISELISTHGGSIKTGPFGTALKASEYATHGVPLISVREIGHGEFHVDHKTPCIGPTTLKRLPEYVLQKGDIVFARKGGIERCALVREKEVGWFLGSDGIRLRPPSTCDARFLAYSLQTQATKDWLLQHSTGSTMASLNGATIGRLPIVLPSLTEQNLVADVLEAFDDRITLLRDTNATLEAIAQALFKSWFVDFDPVRAKMEGRTPEGMDEATAALFPDGFETSELGEVPRGWRVGQVADLGDVVCGKTPPTSAPENYGCDVPFITIPDMHDLLAVTTTARSLSKLGADSQPKKYLPPGAICVSCIATPGLVVRVTTTAQTNQQINSVIPHRKWGSSFPLFLLRRIGDAVRSGGSGGSVFHNLSKSGFEQLPVLLTEPELVWCLKNR